jgi:hypothetical protein
MTVDTEIPAQLVAGDGWAWSDAAAFASHPPPDWALHYVLRPIAGGTTITIVATWGDDTYSLSRTATATAADAPGDYEWTALAYDDASDDRARLGSGRVCILPDPAQATGDLRSGAERILAAIDATVEGRVTKDAESYTIEGRSIARTPMADLIRLQGIYQRRVDAERNPGGSPFQYRRIAL